MPKAQKLTKTEISRLSKLPHQSDLVIEGGRRRLGIYYRKERKSYQPELSLWLDGETGFIRSNSLVVPEESPDGGISEALEGLVKAFTGPFIKVPGGLSMLAEPPANARSNGNGAGSLEIVAGLPAKVVVNDRELADAARAMLEPLSIPVEYAETLETFEDAFVMMSQGMGAHEGAEPPEIFSWDIDAQMLPPLFKAVASYWKRAPWNYMEDDPPLMLDLGENGPEPGVTTLYASILGGGGMFTGIAFYYSLEAFMRTLEQGEELAEADDGQVDQMIEMLRQAGAPIDNIPPNQLRAMVESMMEQEGPSREEVLENIEDCLALYLEDIEEVDPTYLEWLEDHGLKYPSKKGIPSFQRLVRDGEPRPPNVREIKTLTLAIEALNQFFSKFRDELDSEYLPMEDLHFTARVGEKDKAVPINVSFPPPGYEYDEDDEDEDEDE
jgi:predicted RNase H-like HicB family nuclease